MALARRSKKDSLETKESLLDAALEVFHERGVSRPSLSDIAARAGVTRGAVYGHFQNKADLFGALLDRAALPAEVVSSCPYQGSPLDRLRQACLLLLRQATADRQWRCLANIVFHKCEKLEENGAILQRLQHDRREGLSRMKDLVQQAVAAGELPSDLNVDPAVELLRSSLVGVIYQWVLQPEGFNLARQAEAFADALIHMLSAAPSLRLEP